MRPTSPSGSRSRGSRCPSWCCSLSPWRGSPWTSSRVCARRGWARALVPGTSGSPVGARIAAIPDAQVSLLARGTLVGGIVVLALAISPPFDRIADRSLTAHMAQHLLLTLVAAPLLVVAIGAWPRLWVTLRTRVSGRGGEALGRVLTHPLVALAISVGVLWAWHAARVRRGARRQRRARRRARFVRRRIWALLVAAARAWPGRAVERISGLLPPCRNCDGRIARGVAHLRAGRVVLSLQRHDRRRGPFTPCRPASRGSGHVAHRCGTVRADWGGRAARRGLVARRRVFSGIQPTGKLHLGNYIGAISLWVATQAEHEAIFCIADLHALTIPEAARAAHLRAKVRETAAVLVACGIDPARAILFVQSHVPAHTQLAWLLSCVTPVGWLERMIQFKTRSAGLESVGTGLLAYPVLQAADILLYRADLVPVGEDQQQHIELTRDVARRFHTLFGQVFTLPEPMLQPSGARIMGLDDPSAKMSKSRGEPRPRHAIGLVAPPDVIP